MTVIHIGYNWMQG